MEGGSSGGFVSVSGCSPLFSQVCGLLRVQCQVSTTDRSIRHSNDVGDCCVLLLLAFCATLDTGESHRSDGVFSRVEVYTPRSAAVGAPGTAYVLKLVLYGPTATWGVGVTSSGAMYDRTRLSRTKQPASGPRTGTRSCGKDNYCYSFPRPIRRKWRCADVCVPRQNHVHTCWTTLKNKRCQPEPTLVCRLAG